MPVNWIDVSQLSFNTILLLERIQLSWLPGWLQEVDFSIALRANPVVEWYLRHKCPDLNPWLDQVMALTRGDPPAESPRIRQAEMAILNQVNDLLVYALDPALYDAQPFLGWNSTELINLIDFSGKCVIDIGAGTGRLTFLAAEKAEVVFAVEPVANLRYYLKQKAKCLGFNNVFPVDGIITEIPFPSGFGDVVMGGHVFGDQPEEEFMELFRVTKPGGMIILCPGNTDQDNDAHHYLIAQGFQWSRFNEPGDGMKRKYWLNK